MATSEIIALASSLFSIGLAVFTIWLAFQQRRESQDNYDKTKELLSEVKMTMSTVQQLVSDNFQKLLNNTVEQQSNLLDSLKPKQPINEVYMDKLFKLVENDPEKLDKFVEAAEKLVNVQLQSQQKLFSSLSQMGEAAPQMQALLNRMGVKANPIQKKET